MQHRSLLSLSEIKTQEASHNWLRVILKGHSSNFFCLNRSNTLHSVLCPASTNVLNPCLSEVQFEL